jgi:chromosome partitioning protein
MKSLVLFNNKGGVGKTTLLFNIAHMLGRLGLRVVVLDYDPQCNISAIVLGEEQLVRVWEGTDEGATVAGCVDRVRRGKGDVVEPRLVPVPNADNVWLLPGHLGLSRFEQTLAEEWNKTSAVDNERALDVTLALSVLASLAAKAANADLLLCDVGPSLGALNRAALLACDAVLLPLAPDMFSLQGLQNVGPTMLEWRHDASRFRDRAIGIGAWHEFRPIGYVVQQYLVRADRTVKAYEDWGSRIPSTFHEKVLGEPEVDLSLRTDNDPYCLAQIRHFAGLVPLAQQSRKPLFDLKRADGVSGGGSPLVHDAAKQFRALCKTILKTLDVAVPK